MLTQPRRSLRRRSLHRRIRDAYDRLGYHAFMVSGAVYVSAASLIGFDTLGVVIGYATMAPVAVPLTVAAIALVAVIRRHARRAR